MRQDRFLTGILIFIGLLVVLALGIFFTRRGTEQTYGPDDTPLGVVRNYVLALQKADYGRAYTYLAPQNKPTNEAQFRQSMANFASQISSTAISFGDVAMTSTTEATVNLDLVQDNGGLFSTVNHQSQSATLVLQAGAWKITTMPYPYWGFDFPPVKAEPAPTLTPLPTLIPTP